MTTAPTDRPAARQAIAHALDRTALLQRTFGAIDPDLVVSQDHLVAPSQPSYTASSAAGEYPTPDLDTTDSLLRSVGYHRDDGGHYVDAAGKPLTLRMAVETGDPWIGSVAAQITDQLAIAGITVVTVPVDGDLPGLSPTGRDQLLRHGSGHPDGWALSDCRPPAGTPTPPAVPVRPTSRTGASSTIPMSTSCSPRPHRSSTRWPAATVYGQIDDQLWDQMVALPLFGEPGLLANGVQITGMEYNPSEDGVLWNLPQWNLLKPGPAPKGHGTGG